MHHASLALLLVILLAGCGDDRMRSVDLDATLDANSQDAGSDSTVDDAAMDDATIDDAASDDASMADDAGGESDLGMACADAIDCPGVDDECATRTCTAGVCDVMFAADGAPIAAQAPGDCRRTVCDGAGNTRISNDDTDVPTAVACVSASCVAGVPTTAFEPAGTACSSGGGVVCDGLGGCVECLSNAECTGVIDECRAPVCLDGACEVGFNPTGTALAVQVPGDCRLTVCDGAGGTSSSNDDSDVPAALPCRIRSCSAGTPTTALEPAGTSCASGGGVTCDGAGACVACLTASACTGIDDECGMRTCIGGACGRSFTASGTPVAAQLAGNCRVDVCNGAGGVRSDTDDTDVPASVGECSTASCAGGTVSITPRAAGGACSAGVCDGAGTCVGCLVDTDCGSTGAICAASVCARLVISEIQTRGSAGGNDDFVEIYNAGASPVTFDSAWTLRARSATTVAACAAAAVGTRFTGSGQVIPSHGHLLLDGSGFDGGIVANGRLSSGITDGGNVMLMRDTRVVDALCFSFSAASLSALTTCSVPYVCEGTPSSNLPHNDTTAGASNTDVSLERRPGAALGNGQDTGDNIADFANGPSAPQNLSSPITP